MTDGHSNLIPLYVLETISTNTFLAAELGMLTKSRAIDMHIMKDRAGDIRAYDVGAIQGLIDRGKITLRDASDDVAWSRVGGYETCMQKYGLRPKE